MEPSVEIEKLKNKVAELLEEKRKIKAQLEEVQQTLETVTSERDQAVADVQRITVEQPRGEVFRAVAVDGMADALQRELEHHFEVVRTDDGRDLFHRDGQPVELEGKPVELTEEGINALHDAGLVKLGAMLKGSQASGGGATGSKGSGTAAAQPKQQAAPTRHFGLR